MIYKVTLYDENLPEVARYHRQTKQDALDLLESLFLDYEIDAKQDFSIPENEEANLPAVTCWNKGTTSITCNFAVEINF